MHHYTLLRLLLVFFFLYVAWPYIPEAESQLEKIFWAAWLIFFIVITAANSATLLAISEPPMIEKPIVTERKKSRRMKAR